MPRRVLADKTNADRQLVSRKRPVEHDASQRPLKFSKIDDNQRVVPPIRNTSPPREEPPQLCDLRLYNPHRFLNQLARGQMRPHCTKNLSTRPQLSTFVSSNTADVYKLFAHNSTFALPTCCAYSSASKRSGKPVLAVGTELGTLEIMETPKRMGWEFPSQRTSISVTDNMVFDVKWRDDDALLAVATADHVVYLLDPSSPQAEATRLQGLTGSAKVVVWDPNHDSLLSSASRKGEILVWDVRESSREGVSGKEGVRPCLRIQDLEKRPPCIKQSRQSKKPIPRSVTSLLHLPTEPHCLVSSGSTNGILKKWDTRMASCTAKETETLPWKTEPSQKSYLDATLSCGSKRSRGISSLGLGNGVIYGLGCDSSCRPPYSHDKEHSFTDATMRTNSFYTRLATSPCGRWLACGSTDGSLFLFDDVGRHPSARQGVRLQGHEKEVGGIDWATSSIATCSDDRTVRIWRPDSAVLESCLQDPEKSRWEWTWMS